MSAEMQRLSQRELRNESGRVLREVAEGRSFVLTNSGEPVGRIVPLSAPRPGLSIVRGPGRIGGWAALGITRRLGSRPSNEILDEVREDRL